MEKVEPVTDIEDVLKKISQAATRKDLWAMQLDHMHERGVAMVSYHVPKTDGTLDTIATDGFPDAWVCKYISENLVKIDPIPELAARLARPFYWHEIHDLSPHSKDADDYLAAMEDAHLGDGLAFYVYGPNLMNAYVGLGFGTQRVDLSPAKVFELQCIAQSGHLRFCELSKKYDTSVPVLSPREQEVLYWVANGKSNSVIAQILSMSPHTVDTHMRGIYKKLDVRDRTTAAIRALGNGLITIT